MDIRRRCANEGRRFAKRHAVGEGSNIREQCRCALRGDCVRGRAPAERLESLTPGALGVRRGIQSDVSPGVLCRRGCGRHDDIGVVKQLELTAEIGIGRIVNQRRCFMHDSAGAHAAAADRMVRRPDDQIGDRVGVDGEREGLAIAGRRDAGEQAVRLQPV